MNWTEEQERVITDRNHNLLVSAAAGSGKTAVLIERIAGRITDAKNPLDVDELLIVTFTRAAAGEMRERLQKTLEKRLAEDPENEHLQKQMVLLHHAQINTIHGFCQYVIRNYFHRINLDPSYKIGQENDLKLMQQDCLDELMEDHYAQLFSTGEPQGTEERAVRGENTFSRLLEAYAPGKSDKRVTDAILTLYEKAISNPDPSLWLEQCRKAYAAGTPEELSRKPWMKLILADTLELLKSVEETAEKTLQMAQAPGGPVHYLPALEDDLAQLRTLRRQTTYAGLQKAFAAFDFQKLSAKRVKEEDKALKEEIQERRKEMKKVLRDREEKFFQNSEEEVLAELRFLQPLAGELLDLTADFMERFTVAKRKKNLCDFADLEHYALQILLQKKADGTGFERTEAARELARHFREVMVDEYQDSNLIQEAILSAVSGEEEGRHNRFMVGDMKQAIYGFRLARPAIFLEKYNRYGQRDREENVRIDLFKNFRSRAEVLDPVNGLFRKLMQKPLGGIVYDEAQALHPGAADYPENGKDKSKGAELLLLDKQDPAWSKEPDGALEAEALGVALRILKLKKEEQVYDRDLRQQRPVLWRDIVILLRNTSGVADTYVRILKDEGIPAYTLSKEGYFSALEVQTVLNYLRLLDNARQDEPLAAVMHSPIGGFSGKEMGEIAGIKKEDKNQPFYKAVSAYAREGEQEELKEKLIAFLEQLENFRTAAMDRPVHELVYRILEETGYGAYAAAMPGGEQREANLKVLIDLAARFEEGTQHGLFAFVRSIEQQEKYQIDTGEVSLYSENEDIVRVMTIHKSKGLEFPIVFLSGCGRQFNPMDVRAQMVLHTDLGIGLDAVDTVLRTKKASLIKAGIARAIWMDNLAEELRILYVAMTRAKEKLILTGALRNLDKRILPAEGGGAFPGELVDYQTLTSAVSYLDWILAAWEPDIPLKIQVLKSSELLSGQREEDQEGDRHLQEIKQLLRRGGAFDPEVRDFLLAKKAFTYPYQHLLELPAKMTVSELKQRKGREEMEILLDPEERGVELYPDEGEAAIDPKPGTNGQYTEEREFYIPRFIRERETDAAIPERSRGEQGENKTEKQEGDQGKDQGNDQGKDQERDQGNRPENRKKKNRSSRLRSRYTQAERGTLYHRMMEHLSFQAFFIPDEKKEGLRLREDARPIFQKQKQMLLEKGVFLPEEAAVLQEEDFISFLHTERALAIARADREGRLHREAPFVFAIPASEIDSAWPGEEKILIQGIVDAWFREAEGIVLIDYKTDHVRQLKGDGKAELRKRYEEQFRYYRRALEQLTGHEVKTMQLYSFDLKSWVEM